MRQFILFRDLEEPDLWLATDGAGRWGEMNGAHRTELDGCYDIDLVDCTPFTHTLPDPPAAAAGRAHSPRCPVVHVDVETLEVRSVLQRYTPLDDRTVAYEIARDRLRSPSSSRSTSTASCSTTRRPLRRRSSGAVRALAAASARKSVRRSRVVERELDHGRRASRAGCPCRSGGCR